MASMDAREAAAAAGDLGQYDLSFDPGEPERYRKDVPSAQVYVLDAGHLALDMAAEEIAALVGDFVSSSRPEPLSRRAG
jgi:hypothetical protein